MRFIMDVTLICSMFEELPRQGPGLDEATAFAFSHLPPDARRGRILDIGCGSGMQDIALARISPDCQITASDVYQPFLNELMSRAKAAGLDKRITTRQASMDDLPFDEKSFDIIWAEGSAFIIGIGTALRKWKKFLKPDGYMMISDCTWFTDSPSDECNKFFQEISPDMPTVSRGEEMIRAEGYSLIGSFRLPDTGWYTYFYNPLAARLHVLREKYAGNQDALGIIQGLEIEMDIFRKYSKEYGYTYFIMKLSS
ncbi:MAG TPA: class I SAM-dependent methyltransferase [Methanospirillum sp.]|uniref:class I SAM-dependent methyltransferase n=1 Tax=Methanospirillum sp. TaxID=45200 RepID=UPI002C2E051E|nr:class I SAM-dependent methyltransferase [Methanospirillum sp.]HOJ97119.1 class I SAM-dependent methyltransferase [Methanospirillum sp.]